MNNHIIISYILFCRSMCSGVTSSPKKMVFFDEKMLVAKHIFGASIFLVVSLEYVGFAGFALRFQPQCPSLGNSEWLPPLHLLPENVPVLRFQVKESVVCCSTSRSSTKWNNSNWLKKLALESLEWTWFFHVRFPFEGSTNCSSPRFPRIRTSKSGGWLPLSTGQMMPASLERFRWNFKSYQEFKRSRNNVRSCMYNT